MEVWLPLTSFPGYSVSDEGRVRNDHTGRILALMRNQHGVIHVGLSRDLVQHKRSVAVLVASAFCPKLAQHREAFDTPINLDGDRSNNRASNLMWRPKWFAVKYFRQFNEELRGFDCPIVEVISGMQFENSWQAATMFGLLDREILVATMNRTYVWPTYQKFRVL
jgi:hypothetical protein